MKVYLAGPDVFRKDAQEFGLKLKKKCAILKIEGLFPLDNEVEGENLSLKIFSGNLSMLDKCDAVIANISPFRGPGLDAGTAWEIGYAFAKGKSVFLYSYSHNSDYNSRVGSGEYASDAEYPAVENFGLTDNLMIVHSSTDGIVHKCFYDALLAAHGIDP